MPNAERLPTVGLPSDALAAGDESRQPDGIAIYTRELARALVRAGIEVRGVGRAGATVADGVESVNYPLPWRHAVGMSAALQMSLPLAATVERQIDVYHATDYIVPRLARTPVVATLHDAVPLSHPEWANPRFRGVKNRLLHAFAKSASLVIAISNAAVPEIVEHYAIDQRRIRVVPLGVDEQWHVDPQGAVIERTLALHGLRRGFFLHVGTLQPRKNLEQLVDAYEQLPSSVKARRQLVVVGKYGWGVASLRERLRSLRRVSNVVWLEYVERQTLHALYCAAHAFVFPSLAEGFGLPILEALAAGAPVIAADLPALREVAEEHARFVAPGSLEALIEALREADRTPGDAAATGTARLHARKFTWEACALRTLAVYRELTSAGCRGQRL